MIDSPATVEEFDKLRRNKGWLYSPSSADKLKNKVKIVDRASFMNSWLASNKMLILDHCTPLIKEFNVWSFTDKGEPEDRNNHSIDGTAYEFISVRDKIG